MIYIPTHSIYIGYVIKYILNKMIIKIKNLNNDKNK